MEQRKIFFCAALFSTTSAFILQVLVLSLPFWQWTDVYEYVSVNQTRLVNSYVQGLWTICDLQDGYSDCRQLSHFSAWMDTVRTLQTTSTILLFMLTISMVVYELCFPWKRVLQVVFIIVLCISAILIFVGVVLYGIHTVSSSLHFAFAFAVLAAMLALVAALLLLIMSCCDKQHKNRISTIEVRSKQNVESHEVHRSALFMSQARDTSSFKLVCGEGENTNRSNRTCVDRSTSMTSLLNKKVHLTSKQCQDTMTRSTSITPSHSVSYKYKHRKSPVYCKQNMPDDEFHVDQGLHGPCPNSIFCCRCQHRISKTAGHTVCDCITDEDIVCDKCRDKTGSKQNEVLTKNRSEKRQFSNGDDSKYVEMQQVSLSKPTKESTARMDSQSYKFTMRSENATGTSYYDSDKNSGTVPSKSPENLSETPNSLSNDKQNIVKEKKNTDLSFRVIDHNDATDTNVSTENELTDRPGDGNDIPLKKAAKARRPVRSRYAFDRKSGTLPNYNTSDNAGVTNDDVTVRPGLDTSDKGVPVAKKQKVRNSPQKWNPPKWI